MLRMDGRWPPELADVFFGGVEGVYGPQSASGTEFLRMYNKTNYSKIETLAARDFFSSCAVVLCQFLFWREIGFGFTYLRTLLNKLF
jgi:hypothetical protein